MAPAPHRSPAASEIISDTQPETSPTLLPTLDMENETSLLELPDDCLLLVIEAARYTESQDATGRRDPLVKKLSSTCRRLRSLCLPFIFPLQDGLAVELGDRNSGMSEQDLLAQFHALQRSAFAQPLVKGLSVHLSDSAHGLATGDHKQTPSTTKLFGGLLHIMTTCSQLQELQIFNVVAMEQLTRQLLKSSVFDSIETLVIHQVPEAAVIIGSCPNLTTFRSTFPFRRPKTTLKALASSSVTNVELRNDDEWKKEQFEEIFPDLRKVTHLCLSGSMKDLDSIADVVVMLPALHRLKSFNLTTAISSETPVTQHVVAHGLSATGVELSQVFFQRQRSLVMFCFIPRIMCPRRYRAIWSDDGSVANVEEQDTKELSVVRPEDFNPFGSVLKGQPW